jgi:hypothetical protein
MKNAKWHSYARSPLTTPRRSLPMTDADKKLLELSEKANAQGLLPMTVFRCEFDRETEPDVACGFNGCILDASNDECHHVLSLAEANYIVAAANAVPRLVAEKEALLKRIERLGNVMSDQAIEFSEPSEKTEAIRKKWALDVLAADDAAKEQADG